MEATTSKSTVCYVSKYQADARHCCRYLGEFYGLVSEVFLEMNYWHAAYWSLLQDVNLVLRWSNLVSSLVVLVFMKAK